MLNSFITLKNVNFYCPNISSVNNNYVIIKKCIAKMLEKYMTRNFVSIYMTTDILNKININNDSLYNIKEYNDIYLTFNHTYLEYQIYKYLDFSFYSNLNKIQNSKKININFVIFNENVLLITLAFQGEINESHNF